jgi:hypothetical protein
MFANLSNFNNFVIQHMKTTGGKSVVKITLQHVIFEAVTPITAFSILIP